jgi:hypothetical protein
MMMMMMTNPFCHGHDAAGSAMSSLENALGLESLLKMFWESNHYTSFQGLLKWNFQI